MRSRAFRKLAEILGPRAADLAEAAPATGDGAPLAATLARAIGRRREALVASGFWGRDLVTIALLDFFDTSLPRLASETGIDLPTVRERWFAFLAEAGEHRTADEWVGWWESEKQTPPGAPYAPVAQKTGATASGERLETKAGPASGASGVTVEMEALRSRLESEAGQTADATPVRVPVRAPALDDFAEPLWMQHLTPAARALLASAWGLATTSSDTDPRVGVAHLLAAAAEEPHGVLLHVLEQAALDRERFLAALVDAGAPPFPPTWSPMPVDELPPTARDAREALVVAFGRAGAAPVDATHVVEGALSLPRAPAVLRLRELGLTRSELPWALPLPILQAGYRSDSASGEDRLGVLREARTLAAVMASTAVDPPLSIGLFGPWGSGKSFFMRLLQEEVRRLAASGSKSYCANVVQIRFNAWHYIDGNLWASLASEVFEQLGREVEAREAHARGEEPGVKRARLLMAARRSRSALEEAEARRAALGEELERARAEVETLRGEHWRERAATSAPRVTREAIERLGAKSDEQLRDRLRIALLRLGLPADDLDPANVRRALSRPARTLAAWWQALRRSSPRQWLFLALGLAIAFLVAWRGGAVMAALGGAFGKVVSVLSVALGALPALRSWGGRVRSVLRDVKPVAAEFERYAGNVRDQLEAEERTRVELVLKQLDTAKKREDAARARLGAVEEELATLLKADELATFVQERRRSRYYQEQLGVIAQARQDFEQLSRLLHANGGPGPDSLTEADRAAAVEIAAIRGAMPEVDRIVLYIDDLDRCPEAQVVDVLQAVHLLLAFPLFVVVVGVDPRWLIHALADRSEVFRAAETPLEEDDEGRRHWRSTPLDYLEKIFQIPFHLRPMGETGFGDLIDDITGDGGPAGAAATPGAEGDGVGSARTEAADPSAPANAPAANAEVPVSDPAAEPEEAAEEAAGARAGAGEVDDDGTSAEAEGDVGAGRDAGGEGETGGGATDPEQSEPIPEPQLSIAPWERTFMKALHPFIASPRAAKRYVNVYRLIRAAHIAPTLGPLFEAEAEVDPSARDGHRTVLLLLAMLNGYPAQAIAFFRSVVDDGAAGTLSARTEALRASLTGAPQPPPAEPPEERPALPSAEWAPFLSAVERGRAELAERGVDFDPTTADMRAWIPSVARYAFVSGQALRGD